MVCVTDSEAMREDLIIVIAVGKGIVSVGGAYISGTHHVAR